MKLSEDEAKRFLERLCPLQETEQQLLLPAVRPQRIILRAVFFPEQFEQIRSCIYLRKVLDG